MTLSTIYSQKHKDMTIELYTYLTEGDMVTNSSLRLHGFPIFLKENFRGTDQLKIPENATLTIKLNPSLASSRVDGPINR